MRDTGKGLWESQGRLQLPGFSNLPQSSLLTRILTSRLLFSDTSYVQPPHNSSAEVGVCSVPTTYRFGGVQLLSYVRLFAPPWTAACQASLSFTISWSLLKLTSIELMMPSNHLILCLPFPLLPSVFPSIRVFSSESALRIKWPKYWNCSTSPSDGIFGLISLMIDWFDLFGVQGTLKNLSITTVQKHQFFGAQPSLWSSSHIHT